MTNHSRVLFCLTAAAISYNNTAAAAETTFYLNAQAQWSQLDIKADNENNPDNRIFNLPDQNAVVELRPTLAIDWAIDRTNVSVNLEPRLIYSQQQNDNDLDNKKSKVSLRYWKVEWLSDSVAINLDKTVKLWGPSVIFSPSNRYHIDNGRTSPNSELLAREYVDATWYVGAQSDLQLIANVGAGDQVLPKFERSGDLRLNWVGESTSVSAQTSWLNPGWGLGGLAQWTVNDGLLVYVDGLYAPFPSFTDNLSQIRNPNLASVPSNDKSLRMVGGFGYTFASGFNLALDYYYNGTGLDHKSSESVLQQNNNAVSQILQTGFDPSLGLFIEQANSVPAFNFSKRYAVARLSQNNLWDNTALAYILIENLDDRSRQHIVTLDYEYGERISLFANASLFSGDSLTEFGRFYDSRISAGFRWVMY